MEFGKHCALGSCQQLDFLPFVCEACSQVFCKEHCKPEQHQCDCLESTSQQPSIGQTSGESKPLFPCELSGCDRSELVAINCVCCHKNFCIIHRHPDDHDCQEKSVSSSNVKKISLAATNSPRESKGVGRRSEKCSQMVTMMRLKQKAQGPSSIAQSYRVFYNVTLPNGDVKPLFFSKDWSVGKVIDHVAAMFHVKNTNHHSTSEAKLVLLSSEDKVLDVKISLSSQQTTGSSIQLSYIELD